MKSSPRPEAAKDPLTEASRRAPRLVDGEVDFGMMAGLTGFRIKLAWIIGYSLLTRNIGDPAVTPQRFTLLELIAANPGLSQAQLADALRLSRPATTLAVDFWQGRGCVERRTDPKDRRAFGIYLTPHGKAERERIGAKVLEAEESLVAALSEDENAELHRILAKIHR